MKNTLPHLFLTLVIFCLISFTLAAQDAAFLVEAESGTPGGEYSEVEEDGVTFMTVSTDLVNAGNPGNEARIITFSITFPASGTYDLYGRIRVGSSAADDDSFFYASGLGEKLSDSDDDWITINNIATGGFTNEDDFVTGEGTAPTETWKWINLSEFTGQETPVSFTVEEGLLTQTFQIGGREDGFDIDKFAFGNADLYYTISNLENGETGSTELPDPDATPPIAEGQSKFIGSAYSNQQAPGFTNYWNQVTPENDGKWGSAEPQRDVFNWGGLDAAYNLAKDNNMPFKLHVLIWGNQQPAWIEDLTPAEQLEEIEEWFDTLATRYPEIDFVEVVNEPLHDPPNQAGNGGGNYIEALGGSGMTGWDWIITSFELARTYFPDAELMLNDYGIIGSSAATNDYLEIINLLNDEGLIDQIGVQAHAFTVNDAQASTITANLNLLAATGLPIYATELDLDGPTDDIQLERYMRVFPAFWEHESVQGITLWGYRPGLWREEARLIETDGTERPALKWLRAYVNGTFTEVSSIAINSTGGDAQIDEKGGTLQVTAVTSPDEATITDVVWSSDDEDVATVDEDGLVTAIGDGEVIIRAEAKDGSGVVGTLSISVTNQVDEITGIDELEKLVLYPNPVKNGSFTINGVDGFEIIKVLDLRGNILQEYRIENVSSINVRLLNQSKGIYFVQLYDANEFTIKKIILN